MKIAYFVTLLLILPTTAAAIVNIESLRTTQKKGIHGGASISTSNKKGNADTSSVAGALFMTNINNETEMLALLKHSGGHTGGVKSEESSLIHLRYGRKISPKTAWETFLQGERDIFKKVDSKGLFGLGGRFELYKNEKGEQVYFGAGLFYSRTVEIVDNLPNPFDELGRANLYLSGNKFLVENVKLTVSGYYQPNLKNERDYILIGDTSLDFIANENISISYTYNFSYDNIPPSGARKSDQVSGCSIKYSF